MTPIEFDALRKMLKSESGLVLTDDKQYLIETRLEPVAKQLEYESVKALITKWHLTQDMNLQSQIVQAMTINESFFFRDNTPFENFKSVMLPFILKHKKTKHLRIWSAAAATGQEAYSLAMMIKEQARELEGWKVDIVATDLCEEALEKARKGLYSQFEVQRGMPVKYLVKNFTQDGSMWQINDDIRSKIQFRKLNLLDSFSLLGRFDIIFCRNVLIYFDKPTKQDILARMEKQSSPDCFLVLGASETLVGGLNEAFKPVKKVRGLYQLPSPDAVDATALEENVNQNSPSTSLSKLKTSSSF